MSEEMNQLEFKYLLLSQFSNYKEIEKLLKNGNTEEDVYTILKQGVRMVQIFVQEKTLK